MREGESNVSLDLLPHAHIGKRLGKLDNSAESIDALLRRLSQPPSHEGIDLPLRERAYRMARLGDAEELLELLLKEAEGVAEVWRGGGGRVEDDDAAPLGCDEGVGGSD